MSAVFQLIEQYGINPDITSVVDAMDWYVLPVLNADGYVYSWTSVRYFFHVCFFLYMYSTL